MRLDPTTVAMVTGAASGLGAALARRLDARGVKLALCDLDEAGLKAVSSTMSGTPFLGTVDVSDEDAVQRFAADAAASLGRINLVIANAGIAYMGSVEASTTEAYERVLGVDLWGVIHTVRAVLPPMTAARDGYVVTISSLFGLIGVPNQSAYCAAKAGVKGFTESLDMELRSQGVGVLCVHPGAIATNIVHNQTSGATIDGPSQSTAAKVIARGLKPEVAAERILTAVERGKRRLILGPDAKLVAVVQRVFPVYYRDLVLGWSRRMLKRTR